jgi:fructosamine-3-kinase
MRVPTGVRAAVESALEERTGRPTALAEISAVGGGCISPTARVRTEAGDLFFLKWSEGELPDALLTAEARGLQELAAADALRVPEVVGAGSSGAPPWLLLEWLEPGPGSRAGWERLGNGLATLHRSGAARFGAERQNFIGSLPQDNRRLPDWSEFWRELRLEPQLRRAEGGGLLGMEDRRRFDLLYDRLGDLLSPAEADGPSLLHGDLWSGNVLMLQEDDAAVIDPAVYHGHREVDLAMAELFGRFGAGFRAAYEASWPLSPGYPVRRAVYQLYYLLVHVNLFGGGYVGRTRRALSEAGV